MTTNKTLETYWKYREHGVVLNEMLLDFLDETYLNDCILLFGVTEENAALFFEDAANQDYLMDFAIHDYRDEKGKTALQNFTASNQYSSITAIEKEILEAKINSKQSLFLVDEAKPEESLLGLKDVFNSYQDTEIMDAALSRSLPSKNRYIFTRVMRFKHFSCTTGVSYIFKKNKFNNIKSTYLKQLKNYAGLNSHTKKAIAFYAVNTKYGLPVTNIPR